jgi:exopolysaccharide production protein ExoZ
MGASIEKVQSIQTLRFIAAAAVVYHHSVRMMPFVGKAPGAVAFGHFWRVGAAGVDLFFVISGFVIALTGPLAAERPTARAFLWRRWSRVTPLFWALTVPTVMLYSASLPVDVWGQRGQGAVDQIISTLTFWPAVPGGFVPPYIRIGWTLCFEMAFYVGMGLLLVGGRLRRNLFIGAIIVSLLVPLGAHTPPGPFTFLGNAIFLEFGAGVALAAFWPTLRRAPAWLGGALLIAALAFFVSEGIWGTGGVEDAVATWSNTKSVLRVALFGIPSACAVAGALIINRPPGSYPARGFVKLGDASYSIYLAHYIVIMVAAQFWSVIPSAPPFVAILSTFAASVIAGILIYRCVERPLLAIARRLGAPVAAPDQFAVH